MLFGWPRPDGQPNYELTSTIVDRLMILSLFQGFPERCGSVHVDGKEKTCTGELVRCCFGANVSELVPFYNRGTEAVLNYWAAYQFDVAAGVWRMQPESSFNTNGSRPPHNLTAPNGGIGDKAWLAPQPGGAVFWSLGYYPTGVTGVGPPGGLCSLCISVSVSLSLCLCLSVSLTHSLTYSLTHTQTYTHTHTHTHTHARAHAHTHNPTHSQPCS